MAASQPDNLIERVRKALGRAQPLESAPQPPALDGALVRLVRRDANLAEVFIQSAAEAKFQIERATETDVAGKVIEFLKSHQCRRIGVPVSALFDRLQLRGAMSNAGLDVMGWEELTLDGSYDLDCGVTDVYAAVAETGSIVIRPDSRHGRALSLTPPVHVAIVERANLVADLLDLLEQVSRESSPPAITFVTGPSKTADIEGSLVTGVHGPGVVKLFLLE